MKKLIAIGEALIDFIPAQTGRLQDVASFEPHVGGAPCNVCGAFARLGGTSAMITQLGQDGFGDKIVSELASYGVDTTMIERTSAANTSLAFVALQADGNREFSFYRKPGADMLMRPDQLRKEGFQNCGFLHFCSVSLGDFPMRQAHRQAIAMAREQGALISFDPNIRLPLWPRCPSLSKSGAGISAAGGDHQDIRRRAGIHHRNDGSAKSEGVPVYRADAAGAVYLRQPGRLCPDARRGNLRTFLIRRSAGYDRGGGWLYRLLPLSMRPRSGQRSDCLFPRTAAPLPPGQRRFLRRQHPAERRNFLLSDHADRIISNFPAHPLTASLLKISHGQ